MLAQLHSKFKARSTWDPDSKIWTKTPRTHICLLPLLTGAPHGQERPHRCLPCAVTAHPECSSDCQWTHVFLTQTAMETTQDVLVFLQQKVLGNRSSVELPCNKGEEENPETSRGAQKQPTIKGIKHTKHSNNVHPTKSNLYIQCSPHQDSNTILYTDLERTFLDFIQKYPE